MGKIPEYVKCPECLQPVTTEELEMFGGLCEDCTICFSNDEDDILHDEDDDILE